MGGFWRLLRTGVDAMTSGHHIWDRKEAMAYVGAGTRLLRPANYPAGVPGHGTFIGRTPAGQRVGVINLIGRVFMHPADDPFQAAWREADALSADTRVIVVDFHAEATSEKIALARMLDGRVSFVVGTHTHVQTADEQVFPGGTAFLCDAGFTGPHESVLGREIEPVLRRFLTSMPQRFEVARDRVLLQGAVVEVDEASGRALRVERLSEALS